MTESKAAATIRTVIIISISIIILQILLILIDVSGLSHTLENIIAPETNMTKLIDMPDILGI